LEKCNATSHPNKLSEIKYIKKIFWIRKTKPMEIYYEIKKNKNLVINILKNYTWKKN